MAESRWLALAFPQVENNEVGIEFPGDFHRLQPVMDYRNFKPVALEVIAQQRRQWGFVFDDQRPKAGLSSRRRSPGRTRLIAHEVSASCANSVRRRPGKPC